MVSDNPENPKLVSGLYVVLYTCMCVCIAIFWLRGSKIGRLKVVVASSELAVCRHYFSAALSLRFVDTTNEHRS